MEFENNLKKFLSGSNFSSGLTVKICQKGDHLSDRFSIIEEICNRKDIIHLGCVDHLPLIERKISDNSWLHARLCACTHRCLGIDINSDGVNYLITKLGYSDVICADITKDNISGLIDRQWDYLVMGEILEHVNDPCAFLTAIHKRYSNNIGHMIITVPNAFCWENVSHTFSHEECINTDHRYWFTPYTLAKIITQAGMEVEQFFFCQSTPSAGRLSWLIQPRSLLRHAMLHRYPAIRQTLVMVVKLRPVDQDWF